MDYLLKSFKICLEFCLFYFQKKPVVQIKAASALNRIMVLIDNTLSLLNMFDLEVRCIYLTYLYFFFQQVLCPAKLMGDNFFLRLKLHQLCNG